MRLALGLHRRGWTVEMASMISPSILPEDLIASGIPIHSLSMRPGLPDPRAVWRLRELMARFRPDVVHSHMTHANLLARITRLLRPVPKLICTLHGFKMFGVHKQNTRWRELGHRVTDPLADLTTTICQAAAQSYIDSRAVPAQKLVVVPNGIDVPRFEPQPEIRRRLRHELELGDRFVWLAAGRLEPPKAYPVMLEAFARACGDNRAVLLICGAGSQESAIVDQIQSAGLSDRIRLLGLRRDIPQLMAAADAFVLSSNTEGLPMVLLEASAAGLPIACTAVGGSAEIVLHGRTGFVSPAGDSRALAASMRAISDLAPEDRAAFADRARAHVQTHFDVNRILDRWERLYCSNN